MCLSITFKTSRCTPFYFSPRDIFLLCNRSAPYVYLETAHCHQKALVNAPPIHRCDYRITCPTQSSGTKSLRRINIDEHPSSHGASHGEGPKAPGPQSPLGPLQVPDALAKQLHTALLINARRKLCRTRLRQSPEKPRNRFPGVAPDVRHEVDKSRCCNGSINSRLSAHDLS